MPTGSGNPRDRNRNFEEFEWKQGDYEVWSEKPVFRKIYIVYKNNAYVDRFDNFADAVTGALLHEILTRQLP